MSAAQVQRDSGPWKIPDTFTVPRELKPVPVPRRAKVCAQHGAPLRDVGTAQGRAVLEAEEAPTQDAFEGTFI